MNADNILGYLKGLCRDMDEGKPLRRTLDIRRVLAPVAVPAAMSLALGLGGCLEPDDPTPEYAAPFEVCDDGEDNDGDGLVDCEDGECDEHVGCASALYSVPFETACGDGLDNDGDRLVDCDDEDCYDVDECMPTPEYAAPFEVCDDGEDNDFDGAIDCADEDCLDAPGCATALYMAPFAEGDCGDGVDNDDDGAIDCADEDCYEDELCMATPEYAAPFPTEDCTDEIDNDEDGLVDCDDVDDCELHPACAMES